jgi:hypothetical protein
LQGVDLPCLRFFLRSDRDIRAAYIPSLDEWLRRGGGMGGEPQSTPGALCSGVTTAAVGAQAVAQGAGGPR